MNRSSSQQGQRSDQHVRRLVSPDSMQPVITKPVPQTLQNRYVVGSYADRSRARTMGQVQRSPGQRVLGAQQRTTVGGHMFLASAPHDLSSPSISPDLSCLEITRPQLYLSSRPRRAAKPGIAEVRTSCTNHPAQAPTNQSMET